MLNDKGQLEQDDSACLLLLALDLQDRKKVWHTKDNKCIGETYCIGVVVNMKLAKITIWYLSSGMCCTFSLMT